MRPVPIILSVLVPAAACLARQPGVPVQPAGPAMAAQTAAAPTVRIGDPAPGLGRPIWFRGTGPESMPAGRVVVVEFTAVACIPCRRSAMLLSDLLAVYKDKGLIVLAVCVGDRADAPGVDAYLRAMGPQITYPVAADASGELAQSWLRASGSMGLPTAFVVDRVGRIAWIGNSLDGLERVVSTVLDGSHDPAKARAEMLRRESADARSRPVMARLEEAFKANEVESALRLMDDLAAIDPPITSDWIVNKFAYLLLQRRDADRAYAFAASAADGPIKDNAAILQAIAWMTLAEPGVARRDVPLARRLAERADAITNHADPNILDTLAKAQADAGEFDGAITTQTRAVELARLPTQRRELQQRLDQYRAAKK